jgi:hypothetical protein
VPLQNRVNPFGELIATDSRGTLMGNRGCLHDEHRRVRRPFACRRWIICLLEFRGRHRTVMTPGRYTELFFLDEATALAAGHRPCAECQRARYLLFRELWSAANPGLAPFPVPGADAIDRVLHAERLGRRRTKRTYSEKLERLPPGTMAVEAEGGPPFLVLDGARAPWHPGGYGPPVPRPRGLRVEVLTPPSVVRMLALGYPVGVHPSAPPLAASAAGG